MMCDLILFYCNRGTLCCFIAVRVPCVGVLGSSGRSVDLEHVENEFDSRTSDSGGNELEDPTTDEHQEAREEALGVLEGLEEAIWIDELHLTVWLWGEEEQLC